MTEKEFSEACTRIKLLLFDCDGVLTDGRIVLGSDGMELKFFSTKDGMGICLWRREGFLCGCITGRRSHGLEKRAKELGFDELHQGITDKRSVLQEIMQRRSLQAQEVAFVGDDLNDMPMMKKIGLFFAAGDAHIEVKKRASRVLNTCGGQGAVREAIDLLLLHKGLMEKIVASFFE